MELRDKISLLSDLLNKQDRIRTTLDTRANIMIGIDSALIVFLIGYYPKSSPQSIVYIFALISLFLSLMLAILALKPPQFLRKKGQKESIFYHDYIKNKSEKDYINEVSGVIENEEMIVESYCRESYNLTKYSNSPKKFYAHLSIRVLTYGMLFSVVLYGLLALSLS